MRPAPYGHDSPRVSPEQAQINALKLLAGDKDRFLNNDRDIYVENGLRAEVEAKERERLQVEQEQQQKAELLTPSKRVPAVQDLSALKETEQQVASQLAEHPLKKR